MSPSSSNCWTGTREKILQGRCCTNVIFCMSVVVPSALELWSSICLGDDVEESHGLRGKVCSTEFFNRLLRAIR